MIEIKIDTSNVPPIIVDDAPRYAIVTMKDGTKHVCTIVKKNNHDTNQSKNGR